MILMMRSPSKRVNTEFIAWISDETQVWAIVTNESGRRLSFEEGDKVRVLFNSFAVVLLSE
jgi:molybdopterin-binding protein